MPFLPLNKVVGFNSLLPLSDFKSKHPSILTNSKTYIGIEFEIENVFSEFEDRRDCVQRYWNVTEDGSLRNGGLEFISYPIFGDHITEAISLLTDQIDEYAPYAQCTHRCGIHVHINARDLNPIQVLSWLTLALLYERTLFKISGGRNKNIFCVPLEDWYENVIGGFNSLTTEDSSAIFLNIARGHKYSNINCKPLFEHGTLEFRSMKTTRNKKDILNWVAVLVFIKEYAEKIDTIGAFTGYLARLCALKSDGDFQELNREVFGSNIDLISPYYSAKDLKTTLSIIKELSCVFKSSQVKKTEEVASHFPANFSWADAGRVADSGNSFIEQTAARDNLITRLAQLARQSQEQNQNDNQLISDLLRSPTAIIGEDTTESVDTTRDTVGERLRRNRETISASSVVNLSVAEFNELRADLLAQRTM